MIRAVIFDMFETLITHYNTPLYFGAQMAADAEVPEGWFLPLWRQTERDRTLGKLSYQQALEKIFEEGHRLDRRIPEKIPEETLKRLTAKRIAAKEACFLHLHPEIFPMLAALKEKGLLLGLISNCYSEEAAVIRKSGMYPYFDAAMLSCEQGIRKPEKEIYERCVEALSAAAQENGRGKDRRMQKPLCMEECLYVGDGGSGELEAARELGMTAVQAVWYLKEGTKQPAGRKKGFPKAESPLKLTGYLA